METPNPVQELQVRNKIRERKERIVEYIGDLLEPVTGGFDHVNMDMTFTYLGPSDLKYIEDLSALINITALYKLPQSNYLLRGMLATRLNSAKSRNAKSMDILTTMVTEHKQSFDDKTEKKQGFSWFGFKKKKE